MRKILPCPCDAREYVGEDAKRRHFTEGCTANLGQGLEPDAIEGRLVSASEFNAISMYSFCAPTGGATRRSVGATWSADGVQEEFRSHTGVILRPGRGLGLTTAATAIF
ncbi:hypothetical protein [Parapedobacter pyrenivorans]|uniref:hypothetical protein n=1 Tax=Parapedobacter pyrenivorans TaxID=1305674 RepID=UPI001663FC96|nr:hypothetical protein [Parapedobacter pyrenivorans]